VKKLPFEFPVGDLSSLLLCWQSDCSFIDFSQSTSQ